MAGVGMGGRCGGGGGGVEVWVGSGGRAGWLVSLAEARGSRTVVAGVVARTVVEGCGFVGV